MNHYRKLLLGMVATLSLFATATPVFASTGGTLAKHRDFNTGVSSTATVEKSTSQATQYTSQRQLTASESHFGFNAVNGDASTIKYKLKDGTFAKGWFKNGGSWMYADSNSIVQLCKWVQDGSKWYYVGSGGAMLTGCNVDGYHLNAKTGEWDGNAVSGVLTKYQVSVVNKSSNKYVDLSFSEFKSKVDSGLVKVEVTYSSFDGHGDTTNNAGNIHFYLAN